MAHHRKASRTICKLVCIAGDRTKELVQLVEFRPAADDMLRSYQPCDIETDTETDEKRNFNVTLYPRRSECGDIRWAVTYTHIDLGCRSIFTTPAIYLRSH